MQTNTNHNRVKLYLPQGPSESVLTGIQIHSSRSKKATSLYTAPRSPLPPNINMREPMMQAEWP